MKTIYSSQSLRFGTLRLYSLILKVCFLRVPETGDSAEKEEKKLIEEGNQYYAIQKRVKKNWLKVNLLSLLIFFFLKSN